MNLSAVYGSFPWLRQSGIHTPASSSNWGTGWFISKEPLKMIPPCGFLLKMQTQSLTRYWSYKIKLLLKNFESLPIVYINYASRALWQFRFWILFSMVMICFWLLKRIRQQDSVFSTSYLKARRFLADI